MRKSLKYDFIQYVSLQCLNPLQVLLVPGYSPVHFNRVYNYWSEGLIQDALAIAGARLWSDASTLFKIKQDPTSFLYLGDGYTTVFT